MLAKRFRFTPSAAFSPTQRQTTPHFSVLVAPADAFGICVAISKKKVRTAVLRNTIKRQIMRVVASTFGQSPTLPIQLLVSVRQPMNQPATTTQIEALHSLLEQLL